MLLMLYLIMTMVMSMNDSPMLMWVMMEISSMMFLMAFTLMQNNNSNVPALMLLIQFFSSSLILMGIIQSNQTMVTMGILVKLGMYPAHNWLPMVVYESPWKLNFIMMTLAKIPSFLMVETLAEHKTIIISMMMTAILSTMKLMKTSNPKMLMALSAMLHSSWMISAMMMSAKCWLTYFSVYTMITYMTCKMMSANMYMNNNYNKAMMMMMMMLMFSLIASPPTVMFIGKMYLMLLTPTKMTIPIIVLILSSSLSIVYYSRMFIKYMFMFSSSNKMMIITPKKSMYKSWILLLLLLMIII